MSAEKSQGKVSNSNQQHLYPSSEEGFASASQSFLIMGVVNITPDSFSDGGLYNNPQVAVEKALQLVEEGADIVDLGAESSRPGAVPVTSQMEWARLGPVLETLERLQGASFLKKVSIDSYHKENILKAAAKGVGFINDISGVQDEETLANLAERKVSYVAMHMNGEPKNMQNNPLSFQKAQSAVEGFFTSSYQALNTAGFSDNNIWLDPGIGFGKTAEANWQLLRNLSQYSKKYNLCVGISRKSFIGQALKIENPSDRDHSSKMLELGLFFLGVKMLRTHDVLSLSKSRHYFHKK